MSSNSNTPLLEPLVAYPTVANLPSASPLASNPPLAPLDDIPPLSLETLNTREDKYDGLHLIADSVAQMRQRASAAVLTHPICLAGFAAAFAAVYRFAWVSRGDPGLAIILSCGVAVSGILGVSYFTNGYIELAEKMRWDWLRGPDGEEDLILGARFDDRIIGALVLRLQPNPAFVGKRRSRALALRGGRGVIRAWTTKMKYRGKGMGKDLLLAAVRVTKERCGKDAEVGFAKEHANSVMLLPDYFNGIFKRDEMRATKAVDSAVAEWEASKKRR